MQRLEAVHGITIIVTAVTAYYFPSETLLYSYAILGPAHYLTEISWLYDRRFFLPNRQMGVILSAAAAFVLYVPNDYWFGILACAAFLVSTIWTLETWSQKLFLLAFIWLVSLTLTPNSQPPIVIIGILLPTLIHVSAFTFIFMLLGAFRSERLIEKVLVLTYIAAFIFLTVLPPLPLSSNSESFGIVQKYFGTLIRTIGGIIGSSGSDFETKFIGLLAFLYSYHYFNWFFKTGTTRWNRVSRSRIIFVIVASTFLTGLYFYDFAVGFSFLLFLSFLHVILEFPLNNIAIRQLFALTFGRLLRIYGA